MQANLFSSGRLDIWRLSIAETMESPWIGLGPEGYRFIPNNSGRVQPHNLFIQVFLEWGLLGGGTFLLLLGYGLIKSMAIVLRSRGSSANSSLIAFMVIVTLTLHSLTDGTYYHAQPLFLLALGFSAFPALSHKTG